MAIPVNESDITAVLSDFEEGDYVCLKARTGDLFFARVIAIEPEMLQIETVHGNLHTFTPDGTMPLDEVLRRLWKPLDVTSLKIGNVLSCVVQTLGMGYVRRYARVHKPLHSKSVTLENLSAVVDEATGEVKLGATGELKYYWTNGGGTLEEKLAEWVNESEVHDFEIDEQGN